jgi:hypothetical protein
MIARSCKSQGYNPDMTTPPTVFESVFAFLKTLSDLPGSIQKSAQDLMLEVQQDLAAISDQLATGMAEYERVEAEAFELLKEGWMVRNGEAPDWSASSHHSSNLEDTRRECSA